VGGEVFPNCIAGSSLRQELCVGKLSSNQDQPGCSQEWEKRSIDPPEQRRGASGPPLLQSEVIRVQHCLLEPLSRWCEVLKAHVYVLTHLPAEQNDNPHLAP
jgi:hypothetical protein